MSPAALPSRDVELAPLVESAPKDPKGVGYKGPKEDKPAPVTENFSSFVSTYGAPVIALFVESGATSAAKCFDVAVKEFIAISVWMLQMYVTDHILPSAVPWSTISYAGTGARVVQVLALVLLVNATRSKIELVTTLIPALCKFGRQDGGCATPMLLSLFNGLLLMTFVYGIIYNASVAVCASSDVGTILVMVFKYNLIMSLDQVLAAMGLINEMWFQYSVKDKDGKAVPFAGDWTAKGKMWAFELGYGDEDDEDDEDPDSLRIVAHGVDKKPGAIITKKQLEKLCGFAEKSEDEKKCCHEDGCCPTLMRVAIRLWPIVIVIHALTTIHPSSYSVCPEAIKDNASLVALNLRFLTDPDECERAANFLAMPDISVDASGSGICTHSNDKDSLVMKSTYTMDSPDVVFCQAKFTQVPIRFVEFARSKYYPWVGKITGGNHRAVPICPANEMVDITDAAECTQALTALNLEEYAHVATGYPTVKNSADCLGKGGMGIPTAICKSTFNQAIVDAAFTTR